MNDTEGTVFEGVIASITPALKDGMHESFKMGTNHLYVFEIRFTNGFYGECFGNQTEPKWKAGMKVKCLAKKEPKARNGWRYSKLEEIPAPGASTTTAGRSYNDPVVALQMSKSMAWTCTMLAVKILRDRGVSTASIKDVMALEGVKNKFFNWITQNGALKDRDTLSRRWYALEAAVKSAEFVDPCVNTDEVLNVAEFIIRDVISTTE